MCDAFNCDQVEVYINESTTTVGISTRVESTLKIDTGQLTEKVYIIQCIVHQVLSTQTTRRSSSFGTILYGK